MANMQATALPLFPELLPATPPGIARMAADAAEVDQGHLVEFRSLPVRSILNRVCLLRRGLRFAWAHQPVSWLRIRLPLLLCPLHPRVHGAAQPGRLRAHDLREGQRRVVAPPGITSGADRRGDRYRHRHRSLSAHRAPPAHHPELAGRLCRAARTFDRHRDQVSAHRPRHPLPLPDRQQQRADDPHDHHHARRRPRPYPRASRAAPRHPLCHGAPPARSRPPLLV